jgi:UPF0755 protein
VVSRILAAVAVTGLVFVGFEAFRFLAAGPGSETERIVFELPHGANFQTVAKQLEESGVILSAFKFRLLGKLTGLSGQIKRGEYALNKGMTPRQILQILASGKSIQYPVTFPEGTNIYEMAQILQNRGLYRADDFLNLCRDKDFIREMLGIDVSSLEGYLFPETYNVTKYTPLRELIGKMVQNFKTVYSALETHSPGQATGLPRHELVILASVVEKETGAPEERPLIASVFYNRLKKQMKLQSDPTIIYGIWTETGTYKENLTKEDIVRPTRYNTYTVARLPFGPIANPGRDALGAVLRPAISEYLYFVSRNDGTHVFTRTYEDHMKAVKDFQLNASAREGKSWRDLKKRGGAKEQEF